MEESKPLPQSRKRPLEQAIEDSPSFKMRAVLRDLRPHFIEVLKTPEFRNCKAADDIRKGMKLLMEHYEEMIANSVKLEKSSNGDLDSGEKPVEQDVKPADNPLTDDVMSITPPQAQGTYIVGGSAFGWNFIVYHGGVAVYYGRTKEAFRAANPNSI